MFDHLNISDILRTRSKEVVSLIFFFLGGERGVIGKGEGAYTFFLKLLRRWQTRTHCCGNVVTHDISLRAQTGKHLLRTQNVSEQNQKHFCVPDTKFVSATNVARAGKRGNISVGNNVSSFASTFTQFHTKCMIYDNRFQT